MKRTHRPLTVVALLLSIFMAAMEMTVVSTAMPTVIAELGGIQHYAWVFTAYMLATTLTVPIYGKLADLYGRKPIMQVGLALFLCGSLASGLARNMPMLIAARSLQGLGAGAMQPVSMTIIGDIFTPAERARVQAFFGAIWGTAGLVGPLFGGFIVKTFSWPWVFFINIPFGLAAMLLLGRVFFEKLERKGHQLDYTGALLLALTVVALLNGGGHSWHLAAWPVAAAALFAFVILESRAAEPLLPLDLFKKPVIAVSSVAGALLGAAMISTTTFLPLFVQGVLGGSPTQAGMAVAPMAIGWPLASAAAGRLLERCGYRPLIRAGFLLATTATLIWALLVGGQVSATTPRATSALLGVGLGLANTALVIAVQTSVSWRQRGVATASTLLFRTLGGALGVGMLGSVLTASLTANPAISPAAAESLLAPSHGAHLDRELLHSLSAALSSSLTTVFWMIAAVAVLAFAVCLLFPKLHLSDHASTDEAINEEIARHAHANAVQPR